MYVYSIHNRQIIFGNFHKITAYCVCVENIQAFPQENIDLPIVKAAGTVRRDHGSYLSEGPTSTFQQYL